MLTRDYCKRILYHYHSAMKPYSLISVFSARPLLAYLLAYLNSLLIFLEIRIKLASSSQATEYYAEGRSGPCTSGGNISNSHLPGLSTNFIPGISKPRDATACTGKTTFQWPPYCADRKGKLLRWINFRVDALQRSHTQYRSPPFHFSSKHSL